MAHGDVLRMGGDIVEILLLDNTTVAENGPWVSIPPTHTMRSFAVCPADPKNPLSDSLVPTSDVEIRGITTDVVPNKDSVTGHLINTLGAALTSFNNAGFQYRYYQARNLGAQPGISIRIEATRGVI
jgi:hypothetical protein